MPKDLDLENEADANGADEGQCKDGMGLGDGEGKKDVSDKIESEDQLEEARPAGEEKNEEDKDCKEEDNGIDMSENFDGKLQDLEKNENDEEDDGEDNDDNDLEKEMGETETGADQMTEDIWGDDTDESDTEEKAEDSNEQGKGEQTDEKEFGARDDTKHQGEDKLDKNGEEEKEEKDKPEINEMNEPDINDDQIDPYHGKHNPQPEPEPMDLPDDLNLDGEDEDKEDNAEGEENPFDIDAMKESIPPENEDTDAADQEKKTDADENQGDDSSDEEGGPTVDDTEMKDLDGADPEEPETSDQQVSDKGDEKMEDDNPDKETEEEKGERAVPSTDDGSKETDTADQLENKVEGSRDKAANDQNSESQKDTAPVEENSQDDGNDKGTGQAQSNQQNEGHFGGIAEKNTTVEKRQEEQNLREKRKNPGESDENRALIDKAQPNKKKQRIINTREELGNDNDDAEGAENEENGDIDMCQHVKNTEKFDDYATDAATEEQAKKQTIADEEEEPDARKEESMDVDMQEIDKEEIIEEDVKKIDAEPTPKTDKDKTKSDSTNNREDISNAESKLDVEGDIVPTITVPQAIESAFYTNLKEDNFIDLTQEEDITQKKTIKRWIHKPSSEEALATWNSVSSRTETAARDLSEKLRLVLEPTQATRLKGDYRTGKRINMRKIIPYIASQFRKDKIWLRRTKPSKRNYQILLALDDSSSMKDNLSHELTFESLSLISKAMEYLEVGDLGVVSFGERVQVLHALGKPFNEESGSRLIEEMSFEQKKTNIGEMINATVDMFEEQGGSTDSAKLLIILSDGRINESEVKLNLAVRRAQLANIFIVYIIIETPEKKHSVLDITKVIKLEDGVTYKLCSYMDSFPFKFYMVLRNISSLPGILSDALRQWFEIVGKIDA